jgi:hypothetical protein
MPPLATCFHAIFLFGLFFYPEDGVDIFLRNVSWLSTDYTALCPRRQNMFCYHFIPLCSKYSSQQPLLKQLVNRCFETTCRRLPLAFTLVSCLAYSSILKMESTYSSETSVDFQRTTRRYVPEDRTCSATMSFLYVPNIHLNNLFSNNCLFSSLNVRRQVSHPNKTTNNIMILYIIIFTFLDSRGEVKRFWTEWRQTLPEFNVLIISSWIKVLFVTVVPKCLDFATFSKYILAIFMFCLSPAFWWRDFNTYLVFPAFISRPTSWVVSECLCFSS